MFRHGEYFFHCLHEDRNHANLLTATPNGFQSVKEPFFVSLSQGDFYSMFKKVLFLTSF